MMYEVFLKKNMLLIYIILSNDIKIIFKIENHIGITNKIYGFL